MKVYESFIFTHVPKCGGTSFREYIYRAALASGIPPDKMHIPGYGFLPDDKNISQLSKKELADFRASRKVILAAHCQYNVHRDYALNMPNPFYYIILREPVERFISNYNFFCRHLGDRNLKGVHLNDLKDETLTDMLNWMSNIQLEHLINSVNFIKGRQSGTEKLARFGKRFVRTLSFGKLFVPKPAGFRATQSWLEQAEMLLEEEYGAFGVLEKMDLSLKYLQAYAPSWLQFSESDFPLRNETKRMENDEPVHERVIETIKAYSRFDSMLYEMANKLLHKKTQTLDDPPSAVGEGKPVVWQSKAKSLSEMSINELAEKYPEVKALLNKLNPSEKNDCYPPGHFYSAVFSLEELKAREDKIWKGMDNPQVSGIDLDGEGQAKLVGLLEKYYEDMPFGKGLEGLRYQFENDFYSYTDGIILYSMMRHCQPKKIIEVGSGHTSALMLDTKEHFGMDMELVFIEPFPERLNSLLRDPDRDQCRVIVSPVQEVDISLFADLGKNDILFIDSSHVVKTGSDLHYLLFEVIPTLQPGVFIHFHDVFYPFEYPKRWVFQGRNWNEDYFLRAFLMYNSAFKIRLFAHFLHVHYSHVFKNMPLCYKNGGGNIWLEKIL